MLYLSGAKSSSSPTEQLYSTAAGTNGTDYGGESASGKEHSKVD